MAHSVKNIAHEVTRVSVGLGSCSVIPSVLTLQYLSNKVKSVPEIHNSSCSAEVNTITPLFVHFVVTAHNL